MLSNLRSRIFVMYSLLFLLILLAAVALLNIYFTRSATEQAVAGLDVLAENISEQVRDKFDGMNRVSIQIHFSQNILDVMKDAAAWNGTYNYFDYHPESSFVVQKDFLTILGMDIADTIVNLYSPAAFITTAQSSVDWSAITQDAQSGMLRQIDSLLDEAPLGVVLAGPHPVYWSDSGSLPDYFSLSRRLYDSSTQRSLGIVQVLVPRKSIEALAGSSDDSIHIFFCGEDGVILNASSGHGPSADNPVASDAQHLLDTGLLSPGNRSYDGLSGRKYYISMQPVNGYDYRILILQQNQRSGLVLYLGTALVAGLFLLLVAVTLNLLISRYLTRPLDQIIHSLQQVTTDNLDMDINFHSSCSDLVQLQQIYTEMLARVRESMNRALQSQINEREAYHMALQSQISPHFLYNCIGNISAIAYENSVPEIMAICEKMSGMLRYASNIQRENSTIAQELEYTRNYLDLMRIRYSDEFLFTIETDALCERCPIPRMMLQTIVENCFKHGFASVPFPWSVHINLFVEAGFWQVEVIDNGCGVDEEKIRDIVQQSNALYTDLLHGIDQLHLGGLGLLNSLTRLRLLYNDNIVFSVSKLPRGTIIRFGGALDAADL